MTTVIRKSETVTLTERRREILHAVSWQVSAGVWSPPTDMYETENEYVVRVEVAGMREADFEVVFEGGYLLVNGVRPDVAERRAYHQMEIRFGKFSTAIGIPGPVDLDVSTAEYHDGFLTVIMPKPKITEAKTE
ncbi:MAG: Hsp20/alpha crystallin family protein [Chloroflexi bacterium]|nr:Hsp20/alpha crystallin family protein [Chloroflexota bacterium]